MEGSNLTDQAALVRRAHEAHAAHRFNEASSAFARAHELGPLSAADIVAWSDTTWWLGDVERALELAELGHRRLLEDGATVRAAREAIGLGFLLMLRGDLAAGSGWLQRGRSLIEASDDEAAAGYVVQLDAENALHGGELDRAIALAREAQEVGQRNDDPALVSLALMTEGTAHLRAGEVVRAMALLDEAMLPVTAGQVPADMAGNLYCQMIAICWSIADLRRAREWTTATEQWCEDFDSSVMFSGICRMHRVQLRQVAGDWDVAAEEARIVCTELAGMNVAVVAEGHYLLGDLLRLRGDVEGAESAYRRAHELGRDPQPGRALLAAGRGEYDVALTSLRTALTGRHAADYDRVPLLRALVDIAVDAGDVPAATSAADELATIAERWQSPGLHAAATRALGAARVIEGDPRGAVAPLREAVGAWSGLDATYEAATTRMLLARAYAGVDDDAAAQLELDAAEKVLRELDATVDLRRLERLRPRTVLPGGLTRRETEILLRIADGSTNRQVAERLVISEKTVARHLANLYRKIGVSTRTAAVAWAREQGLRPPA